MANSHTQARASIDLGAGFANPPFTGNKHKMVRNHPPRLQHSPSLPNIWFPPHSGPIPSRIEDSNHEFLERPVSPTPTLAHQLSTALSLTSKKASEHRETLSFDDLTNYINKRPLKLQMHRRIDCDHTHSLLTPPLTPSSSLRTATSVGSSNNVEVTRDTGLALQGKGQEISPVATHFLLLGNISKTTPSDTLRSSIVGSLTTLHIDPDPDASGTLPVSDDSANFGPLKEDSIKGVFVRHQKSHGIVMLAFYDIRHAAVAKTILSTPSTSSPMAECIGDEPVTSEIRTWISCQFITADELAKTIGDSTFLASVNGSFYVSVEGKQASRDGENGESGITDDNHLIERNVAAHRAVDAKIDDEPGNEKRDINISMLKSMLNSFGVLKSFSAVEHAQDKESQAKIFHLEYYDVREANAAYAALDGQVLFGMKLKVFGRETSMDQSQCPLEGGPRCPSSAPNEHLKNIIPFPSTTATFNAGDGVLPIGPPGHYSQTRERFFYPEPPRHRPRSASAGQYVHTTPFPQPHPFVPSLLHPTPSPTYFYTSSPAENQNITQYPQIPNHRAVNQFFADHIGKPYGPPSPPQANTSADATQSSSFESLETPNAPTHQDPGLQFYSPHHDCYYCPSRCTPNTADSYYAPYPTSSPLYYPRLTPCYPATPSPVPPPISMCVPGYDPESMNTQAVSPPPNVVMTHWAFESAMVAASHPATGDFWCPESNMIAMEGQQNIPYYSQPIVTPGGCPSPYHSHRIKPEPQIAADHHVQTPPPTIFRPNIPSAPSPTPVRLTHAPQRLSAPNPREPPVTPERNQLNLTRIEDGQDTRTTVMVKNIPNKMSDKDLIAYIGKVCPRKIDFLYLRMDFQNGCNVGYAFVNFINVQDLLFFAKTKLGEKWNMFSSEKVLQMSYANYQGKEALVEKFKNSCIMDEREAWRPKIFYSDPGPEQGLPEPFPAPTHLRRKERSSFNRGALYVPGTNRGCPTPQINMSIPLRRQQQNEEHSQHGRYIDQERRNAPETMAPPFPTIGAPRRRPNSKTWGTS